MEEKEAKEISEEKEKEAKEIKYLSEEIIRMISSYSIKKPTHPIWRNYFLRWTMKWICSQIE